MTTFGHKIAAARNDGIVNIYDSVTGALRLSLSPTDPIQELKGSPDGSLLFCIHQAPLVTLWDIQTGGLIHTFILEEKAETAAVSLEGRYLAGGFPDGSVKIWEVATRMEGAGIQSGSPITHLCWLEPEQHLAVMEEGLARIWDISAGKVRHYFRMHEPTCSAVYSEKLKRLAILTASETKSTITIICPRTGTYSPYIIRHQLTCFAFSQTAEELVCGTNTPGLRWFNISTQSSKRSDHPTTITSLSTLSNGTVVANTAESGIQLLRLDQGYAPSEQPNVPALTVRPFEGDRILVILSLNRDSIIVLEAASMSLLLTIPIRKNTPIPEHRTVILCASHKNRMVVHCFEEGDKTFLQMWRFRGHLPEWTVEVDELPSIGSISPTGDRLVTYQNGPHQTHICIRDTRNGELEEMLLVDSEWPHQHLPEIVFKSEAKCYFCDEAHNVLFTVSPPGPDTPNHSITYPDEEFVFVQPDRYYDYDVDDTREWVISDSRKICWIPPGYIRSTQSSYCWVGHSLVMIGQDGTLRKLTLPK